jgi:hypothetical protein
MDTPAWLRREVARLNDELGRVLGRTEDGQPLYSWIHSEDARLLHPMWTGQFDYKADMQSGLLRAEPIYILRKMCLAAENQWVLCHYLASPSEEEWREQFGCSLEWPRKGQYYPTSVSLDPGAWPEASINQAAIESINQNRSQTPREVADACATAMDKGEREEKERLYETIREACTTYDHVPGHCDQVSYPNTQEKKEEPCQPV